MPFKSENITYGLPRDAYEQEKMNALADDLKGAVGLEKQLAGVQFFFTKEAYDACEVQEIKGGAPYCVMVQKAIRGMEFKSRLENHKCDGGTTALALEKSTDRIESGTEYYSYNLYDSPAAARRLRNSIKSLHAYQPLTYGIVVRPFVNCTEQPDVIIGIVNAYQTMRIIQGYEYYSGIKPEIDMGAMQGMCSEVTAVPYITGNMNVSVLCPSTRMLCRWKESDMAVGIPFHQFENIVKGVMATKY